MEMDNFRAESTMGTGRFEYRVVVRAPQKQVDPGGLEYGVYLGGKDDSKNNKAYWKQCKQ